MKTVTIFTEYYTVKYKYVTHLAV